MTTEAMIFMAASWAFVLSLMIWSFAKILRKGGEKDQNLL